MHPLVITKLKFKLVFVDQSKQIIVLTPTSFCFMYENQEASAITATNS